MAIQLFVPSYRVEECIQSIRECLESGWTGIGYKTAEFENAWKSYTGFKHAHFVHSATAGLHLAVRILKEKHGWRDGDEIVSTPLTFVSSNHAIKYENLNVAFADVDEYLCIDPDDLERKIGPKTKAVMYVGMGGNTGKYERIAEICRARGLKLILDGAHMSGTRLHGSIPGAEADVVVYSFHSVKNLPTADGGMVCFADAELDAACRKYSWLGINKDTYSRTQGEAAYRWKYDVEHIGFKYHGNSVMAAIGLVQLKYLDEDNRYRRLLADKYDKLFADAAGFVEPIPIARGCEPSRHLYAIGTDRRDELLEALNSHGVYPGVHYRDNTEYPMYAYADGTCPNARRMSGRILSLPLHLKMTEEDAARVAQIILEQARE